MSTVILLDVTDRIGTITLNRPERRNALDGELVAALDAAVEQMAADPSVKVVVLTGAAPEGGHGGFCSGGDVKSGRGQPGHGARRPADALDGDLARHDLHAAMSFTSCRSQRSPWWAGPRWAPAAAWLRRATSATVDAVFATNFSPNGLSGDYGGTFFWTCVAGTAVARRLYLLNEKLTAQQALTLGMVHEVVPAADLRARCARWPARSRRCPPS